MEAAADADGDREGDDEDGDVSYVHATGYGRIGQKPGLTRVRSLDGARSVVAAGARAFAVAVAEEFVAVLVEEWGAAARAGGCVAELDGAAGDGDVAVGAGLGDVGEHLAVVDVRVVEDVRGGRRRGRGGPSPRRARASDRR